MFNRFESERKYRVNSIKEIVIFIFIIKIFSLTWCQVSTLSRPIITQSPNQFCNYTSSSYQKNNFQHPIPNVL